MIMLIAFVAAGAGTWYLPGRSAGIRKVLR